MYQYESKKELREALKGHKIRNVEFGGVEPIGDQRSIALHLGNGESVVISVTNWGTLSFEAS